MRYVQLIAFLIIFGGPLLLLAYATRARRRERFDPHASPHGDVPHVHHGENYR